MSQSKYRADIDGLRSIALAWLSYRFIETPIRHIRAPQGIRVFPMAALIHDGCIRPRAKLEQARTPALAVLRDQPGFHMSASASTALTDSLLAQLASLP